MTLPIGDGNFYYELGDAGRHGKLGKRVANCDRGRRRAASSRQSCRGDEGAPEEAKKNAKSKKFDSVVATAIIQMLKSENEGHKLRLEGERKVLEEGSSTEDLQASLAQSTAQVEAEKTRADQAEEANKAAAVALEEAKSACCCFGGSKQCGNAKMEALEQQTRQAQEQQSGACRNNSRRCRAGQTV